jgi:Putative zinc-finger
MSEAALDHPLLQQLVAAWADGELPRGEARVVQEHARTCARCQREMALQERLSSALAREPVRVASVGLRRRIERMSMPTAAPETFLWARWTAPAAAALVPIAIVIGAALVSIGIGNGSALVSRRGDDSRTVAAVPLLRDAAADCRRVMSRNFPRKADLEAVGEGLRFPVRRLDQADAQLFSTWKTTLAGSPAAGLAYRWRGIVVVQYVVPAELIQKQPEIGEGIRGAGVYFASDHGQGIVASLVDGRGTLLLADAPPEELGKLIL